MWYLPVRPNASITNVVGHTRRHLSSWVSRLKQWLSLDNKSRWWIAWTTYCSLMRMKRDREGEKRRQEVYPLPVLLFLKEKKSLTRFLLRYSCYLHFSLPLFLAKIECLPGSSSCDKRSEHSSCHTSLFILCISSIVDFDLLPAAIDRVLFSIMFDRDIHWSIEEAWIDVVKKQLTAVFKKWRMNCQIDSCVYFLPIFQNWIFC